MSLHRDDAAGMIHALMHDFRASILILTSARMAAGMTSRARRPEPFSPAG